MLESSRGTCHFPQIQTKPWPPSGANGLPRDSAIPRMAHGLLALGRLSLGLFFFFFWIR